MRRTPLFVVAVLFALTGCSEAPKAAIVAASPSLSPSPSPLASGPLALGQTYTRTDASARTTVYAYKAAVAKNGPGPDQEGTEWAGLDAEVCIDKPAPDGGPNVISQDPWALYLPNNGLLSPSGTRYGHFPIPAYPMGQKVVSVGSCVRGWITFVAPVGQKPVRAEYSGGGIAPVSWKL